MSTSTHKILLKDFNPKALTKTSLFNESDSNFLYNNGLQNLDYKVISTVDTNKEPAINTKFEVFLSVNFAKSSSLAYIQGDKKIVSPNKFC